MRKKILSIFLVLCLVVTLLPVGAFADSTPTSGKCGENLTWKLDGDGTLTISGTGKMWDYDYLNDYYAPWMDFLASIEKVVISKGVTSIGNDAFHSYYNLRDVTIPDSITSIGSFAFDGCDITSLKIPDGVKYIGPCAFSDCELETINIGHINYALQNSTIHFKNAHTHSYANGKCTICGAADPNYKPAPKAPELKITTSAGKPKIYWNAVDGAVKYRIYRSTDGKNFSYYDSTKKTSYTNKSTSVGTTYYYKVKSVNSNNAASDYSVSKSILCKPAAPTVSIYRTNGKPKLSWKAVSGAKKYWIYRSTDGKKFKYFDSTTKTSYTNSGAASGTKYYYRVKAVAVVNGKNVASANSSKKSLLTSLAKPSVSITTSNGKPKVTWKAVTGADKYYVYRSTDGKKFSYWDSTTKTSYINSGAKKNTKYYYKVKAVCASNSNANSAQSSAVSIKATK